MRRNVWSDIVSWHMTTQQLYKVSTPCIDDHHFKEEELKSVGELSKICSQIVLTMLMKPVVCRDKNHVHQQFRGMFNVLNNVDRVPSNVQFSHLCCMCLRTTKQ